MVTIQSQNFGVEISLETGEDPPDGGLSPDAKMFVLTPDSSTKKALYFV